MTPTDSAQFMNVLSYLDATAIIPVIENGLELEKLKYLATHDPQSQQRITDTTVLLSFLYFRAWDLSSGGDNFYNLMKA